MAPPTAEAFARYPHVRAFKILAVVVLGAAALLGVALFALTRYLESEAFRRAAVAAAQDTLGASVTVGEMHISLFSGATFRQVVVGNPPGLTGELLRADALVVRPRLLPLLRRRLEIAELRLDAPAITLIRNDHGEWSFERLVSRPVPTPPLPAGGSASGTDAPPPMPVSPALDVVVPRLALPQRHSRGHTGTEGAPRRGQRHRGDDIAVAGRRGPRRRGPARRRVAPDRGRAWRSVSSPRHSASAAAT